MMVGVGAGGARAGALTLRDMINTKDKLQVPDQPPEGAPRQARLHSFPRCLLALLQADLPMVSDLPEVGTEEGRGRGLQACPFYPARRGVTHQSRLRVRSKQPRCSCWGRKGLRHFPRAPLYPATTSQCSQSGSGDLEK